MVGKRRDFHSHIISSNNMADGRSSEVGVLLLAIYYGGFCGYCCVVWLLDFGRDMNNEYYNLLM